MILCAGEALIDMLPRKTETGEAAFAPYPGGSVFNTAVALARLGVPVAFFTGLSTDLFGQRLANVLTANGVGHDLAARSDRPTTLAFVTLAEGQASYAFYDENTAGRMLTEADLPQIPDRCTACFFGGISLAVEPCAEAYAMLAARAAADRVVMLDPNIRPSFIADEARFRARMDGMLAQADIVKLSDEDLQWLMGEASLAQLAADLRAKGPGLVLVTQGAQGVTAYGPTGAVHVDATPVDVVDTVGAGDTFNAGFLAGLSDAGLLDKATLAAGLPEDALRTALSLGVKAAAVTVSRAGANPPHRTEIA
ncbi:Fructokinase [Roseibacterium elongatum DSM 19469]|uniref:Fructokinase n=1 Tax=Roseicyclus elongatus DSM 19469 TaxID=1294273 RepID=W8SSV5_9RHOB|nr:carbohydrate kinase [Roseibacterium elongatum]AHM05610.1 Fructokinase [Roseibacterium elongatum DSM 19469]